MHQANAFERIWALGYQRLCPIIPPGAPISERSSLHKRLQRGDDARGKMPGIQWADGSWSGYDFVAHESTTADLPRWHDMGAGVGVKTGNGLALIDADTGDEQLAAIIKRTVEDRLGPLPVRIGNYPKAGYLIRVDGPFQYARVEFGTRDDRGRLRERVEVLYEGRQFVAHGIHPKTLQPYRWPDGMPAIEDIPQFPAEAVYGLLEALRAVLPAAASVIREGADTEIDQQSLRGPLDLVSRAVRATRNSTDAFPSRESYVGFGYAIKAALPDNEREAFDLYADWCSRWEDGTNEPDIVEAEWRRMKPPFRRGAHWLYELAEQHGDGSFSAAEQWFEQPGENEPLFPENAPNSLRDRAARFAFIDFDDAADTAREVANEPLIDGLLDQGAMTVLYGESNSGKTFVAMDIAYHITNGLPWGGVDVTRCPVVYVAAEGGLGARKRAAALKKRYGGAKGFRYLLQPVDLLHADADLMPLIEALRSMEQRPGLIVIDTLSRALAGGDENTSTDMGAMVKHLDLLRKATGAHLMVVHHSGKDRARGARGHSLLRAATDTEIEVADMQIAVTKQRDLDKSWSSAFSLDELELWRDAKGRAVSSCVVKLADRGAVVTGVATAKEAEVVEAVRAMDGMTADGAPGAALADVAAFMEKRPDKMSKENVRFHLKSLLAKNLIRKAGRGRYQVVENSVSSAFPPLSSASVWADVPEESGGKAEEGVFE